jgi:hypothetical protein
LSFGIFKKIEAKKSFLQVLAKLEHGVAKNRSRNELG